jgi:hypothetical protein
VATKGSAWSSEGQGPCDKDKENGPLAFFDNKVLIYTNYVPRRTTVNAKYIMVALDKFMKIFRRKRPVLAARDWTFHWDNASVHTVAIVTDWMAARQIILI